MKDCGIYTHAQARPPQIYSIFGCSDGGGEEVSLASRVFSSQIPGYDGGEVDTNETVEIIFPLIVRTCKLTCHMLIIDLSSNQ